jgi:hypothetical protein
LFAALLSSLCLFSLFFTAHTPRGGRSKESAAIPWALAEEVAETVHHEFRSQKIRYKPAVELTEEEIQKFNQGMALLDDAE